MADILIMGGSGLVGLALAQAWERRGASVAATYLTHPVSGFLPLDIRDGAAVEAVLDRVRPSLVALPGANPFVDYCEQHPEETRAVNVGGPRAVAGACAARAIKLLFFSSDYVFDGLKGSSYSEDDATAPVSEYGRQKLSAERIVLESGRSNLVVRTSGVYGWERVPKNFVLQVVSRLRKGEAMRVTADVAYNPTNADNLAEVCAELAKRGASGLFHVGGSESVSRYEFARRIAGAFGLDASGLSPASSSEFRQPAARPPFSGLSSERAKGLAGLPLWGVEEGLQSMRSSEEAWRKRWENLLQ